MSTTPDIEQLRAVHALSPWAAMPFWHAMARPVIAAALKLGAAVYAAPPPPLDAKRLAAGEREAER